jgi:hypothetical protein
MKLEPMDEFCQKENIFFTDSDRIKFQIKQSKGQYKSFKSSINNVFSHITEIPDHPNLERLLKDEGEFYVHDATP